MAILTIHHNASCLQCSEHKQFNMTDFALKINAFQSEVWTLYTLQPCGLYHRLIKLNTKEYISKEQFVGHTTRQQEYLQL